MSALFGLSAGRQKSISKSDKTFLFIDVENGSVASALARISKKEPPRLFGERRVQLPVFHPISSQELAYKIDSTIKEALAHTSEVAARMRHNPETAAMGHITEARIFLSAPWARSSIGEKGLQWDYEPEILSLLQKNAHIFAVDVQILAHPFSRAAASAAFAFSEEETLLCIVTGEVIELVLVDQGLVLGRATIPFGLHTVLRTLQSHAGLSLQEALSALRLLHLENTHSHPYYEPMGASARHFAEEFSDAAEDLLEVSHARTILVLAPETVGDWFAKALTGNDRSTALFPDGGVVRTLRPKHCIPYLAAHAEAPDLHLMLETMFISAGHASDNSGI